jgi:hypothetical protein
MALPAISAYASGVRGGYHVQLDHPITEADRKLLEAAGAALHGYVPMMALEVVMTEATRARLETLPGVRFVGPLQPGLKVGAALDAVLRAPDAAGRLRLQLSLFRGEETLTAAQLAGSGARVLGLDAGRAQSVATVEIPARRLETLLRHPMVRYAELDYERKAHNDRARFHSGLTAVADDTFASGIDPSLDGHDATTGFRVKFGHFDTGIDVSHPDLQSSWITLEPGADGSDTDDGHGTHTAGSVLGGGGEWASVPAVPPGSGAVSQQRWRGVAPEASLHHISFDNGYSDRQIFERLSEEGAHVSTNSWGYCSRRGPFCDSITDYNINAALWDEGVWDADDDAAGLQPLIVFFSAGNDGDGDSVGCGTTASDQVGTPGTAKNVITIGANETDRGCNAFADHPGDMIDFSSRGPVDPDGSGQGLFKPDLTQIGGDFVLSTEASGVGGAGRDAPSTCSNTGPRYRYEGGTSMSTPLAAGLGGILVQDLVVHRGVSQPAPSLVKALLVNGASRLQPSGSCDYTLDVAASTVHQGWGFVQATQSLYGPDLSPTARSVDFENEVTAHAVATGESFQRSVIVQAGVPLHVTLVWTDFPAAAGAGSPLVVNDLDLTVVGPEGTFLGNHFSTQGWSEVSAQANADRYNVVESVRIQSTVGGTYDLQVSGFQVSQDQEPSASGTNQDFSLVWSFPRAACADGIDNDTDGLMDFAGGDPGCADADDDDEQSPALVCDDGLDNDLDGLEDLSDPACRSGTYPREHAACQDGADNDGDGLVDFDGGVSIHGEGAPEVTDPDPQCADKPWRNIERSSTPKPRCGLGFESTFLLVALASWRRARRRGSAQPCSSRTIQRPDGRSRRPC